MATSACSSKTAAPRVFPKKPRRTSMRSPPKASSFASIIAARRSARLPAPPFSSASTRGTPTCANLPNIIFVLADDLGYGDLGVLFQNSRAPGFPKEATPNLDAFAAEGIQVRRHYCGAPVCAPSRASFLLGVHQGHANVRDTQFDKALATNHNVATVLKQAGYATAAIG